MRIVAGHFRSRILHSPRDLALRPTSDRLRETIFNVLGERVLGSTFIDACAGTGAAGIEAISRGAARAMFIEKHSATAELIRKNLYALDILFVDAKNMTELAPDRAAGDVGYADVIEADANAALKKIAAQKIRAQFIFADPPYADVRTIESILKILGNTDLLAPHGLFIAEHSSRVKTPDSTGKLRRTRLLKQGDSAIGFYEIGSQ